MSITNLVASPTRSVLGPLTTVYTPPAICFNYAEATDSNVAWGAQGCSTGNVVDTSSCWPPALASAPEPPFLGWGFYSPGLICPTGYTSACTAAINSDGSPSTITEGSSFSFQFPLEAGETAIGCCPSGFTCGPTGRHVAQTCVSVMTTGSFLAGFCQNPAGTLTDFQYINVPAINTINAASSTFTAATLTAEITSISLFAPLFQINFQASDKLANAALATSTNSAAYDGGLNDSSGLSTGAKIAIGVAAPLFLLLLAGIVACVLLRRRRLQKRNVEMRDRVLAHRVVYEAPEVPRYTPRDPHKSYHRGSEFEASSQWHDTGMPLREKSFYTGTFPPQGPQTPHAPRALELEGSRF